ncbi:eukaryotic translation initiation factor 3 subunit F [Kwoniella mangroviensis CBS 10435]|uniref:Eukaryotic translation initiation factor 3 subunit F n=1 Tax=Kwoniella mangroviensis CBS 10435 TaxID=1331196 RepID=A0A1B9IUR4_9TREE|nr:eukaryotic translation initiation factor 3 subunit F [Kwoniella mangroviensis CBS 8507]OCF59282.1 eukaryotic translation initiation factor 3 subunit F [Kwoniella mangroviensis CBS 10435]OCF69075.1 eukaryotic translation initiation factor 3 subunit F [Kwoniella mangroviensis CBS 8507]OCF76466.1 eukaryotic translation initiation factor 3 subunit F [Kwoniella mangroviensis CBS 8886]
MSLDTSSSAIHLNLPPTSTSQLRPPTLITVHPSVVASILTHHSRRPTEADASPRVIGTLMGSRSDNGQEVDVRACFAVPHKEDENQIAVDMPFQQGMMQLLGKTGAKESIVGWYATHPTLNAYSALIQNYFSGETSPHPSIHLTIDTELDPSGKGLGVKGWVSTQLGLSNKPENCAFLPVPVVIKYAESERAALDLLTTAAPTPSPSLPPLPTLSASLGQLSELIDQCLAYVQKVNSGEQSPDPEVGRYLLEGLGRWSSTKEGTEDEGGIKAGLQDTLTVSYLSNLVRSQIELSGRLALLQQAAAQ